MPFSNATSPYTVNGFTNNPPTGGITQFQQTVKLSGFIASSGSFGVAVQAFEAGGKAYVALYRMYGSFGKLTLFYNTSDGTAVAGVDYTATSGTVVWQDQEITAKVVQIPLLQTTKIANQFFNFNITRVGIGNFPQFGTSIYVFLGGNLNPFPGPSYAFAQSFPITIVRQGRGELDFVGTPYSVQRPGGSTTVTLQVQRFTGFKGVVGCSFHTTDGTAVAGVAYTAQSGTLSWADGEGGTKNIVITILSGGAGTQSFTVTIDTPTGGVVIGSTSIATVNITPGAPPANPVAGGSIPQQLGDVVLPSDPGATFEWRMDFMSDDVTAFWRNNILFGGILANKIGNFIGFGPGTDSFGGGTDIVDGTPFFNPLSRFRFQGHIVG